MVAKLLFSILFFTGLFFVQGNPAAMAQTQSSKPAAIDFPIKRGINISHWLSQSTKRGTERKEYFTKKDVAYLAGLGFDHLRIPVDEEQLWTADGKKDQEAFGLLHQALEWCQQNKLKAIVDLHILRSHHFNEKEKPLWTQPAAQERFFQCWRDLSAELKKYPATSLAYELMNEPVADDPEDWNKLVEKAVAVVRAQEPERKIVIGSNRWQSADTFDQLRVPSNDPNIILSFHMYEPFLLTHHQASWTDIKAYKGPVNYPGQIVKKEDIKNLPEPVAKAVSSKKLYYTKEDIEAHFQKPLAVAKKYNLPLYCGEWGCLATVPEKARLQWYTDMKSVLEKHNIAWATWDYKGSFGIVDQKQTEQKEMIRILVGTQK
ncbi:glycoside hydrolase family 5 protein [Rhodocytophaga aerolata]|uniref:Glycoside hydrolase family 5 protein n=1 Tax=Rhodocytophaga aerolata TaxID=455078 RepID=A0ABT8R018_9BACT|nr:glycoside hydrolase family 5 protein [Rhodocytophaga aerolata]MDO1445442.1 glycoside hydrolase family 5 protein [Rhodocytophaga aerolata]